MYTKFFRIAFFDYHGNHVFQHNEFLFVGPIEQFDTHKKLS